MNGLRFVLFADEQHDRQVISYTAPEERTIRPECMADYHTTALKTWIGGSRKRAESWNHPANWYPFGVPKRSDKVIIGGYGLHRCTLRTSVECISGLSILPQAKLVIEADGSLCVDGCLADPHGMLGDSGLSNHGLLHVRGELILRNAALQGIANHGLIINEGCISTDASVSTQDEDWGRYADRGERKFLLPG